MDESTPRPPSPKYLSKTPSWISLGFVLGALFVWTLPSPESKAPATAAEKPVTAAGTVKIQANKPKVTDIEAVFAIWGSHAVWTSDLTEVALWDIETEKFSLYYEVLRSRDAFYFRSIDRLTRPVLTHGVKMDGPLLFTETEEMRQEWLHEKANENWKAMISPLTGAPSRTTPEGTK
ncbi:MAG: hypothetical protein KA257_03930 [Opitutaceae bacterium]|nr:hypothetical protein [Opitutaceae bacterium]MBP9913166.1 hypothetical protein [Opitutaceae bacterium]